MKKYNILSFGGGVQSTALLAMAVNNDLNMKIDCVIFSDTGWEPKKVYKNVEMWETRAKNAGIDFYKVSAGNIKEDILSGGRFASMPFYIFNDEGEPSILRRQCTREYKIGPVKKAIRKHLFGLKKGQRFKKDMSYNILMGISLDEIQRVNPSTKKYENTVYPLIDKRMTRIDCYQYLRKKGYEIPKKSSCIGCPFHDNNYWLSLSDDEFREAVEFEKEVNRIKPKNIRANYLYLHPDRVPLDQVDFNKDQTDLGIGFINECMGGCGI